MQGIIVQAIVGMLFSKTFWKSSIAFWLMVDVIATLWIVAGEDQFAKGIREIYKVRYEHTYGMPFTWHKETDDYTIIAGMKLPPVPELFREKGE